MGLSAPLGSHLPGVGGWLGGQQCAHHPPPSPGALEADNPPLQRRPSPSLCLCSLTHFKHSIKPHPIPWGPCPGLGCPCLSPNPGRGGGQACSASSPPAPRLSQARSTNGTGLADRQTDRQTDGETSQCRQNLRQGLDGPTSLRSSNTTDTRQAVVGSVALCRPASGPWVGWGFMEGRCESVCTQ